MADDVLLHLMRQMLYVGLMLLLPPIGIALVVGLGVGLLQAITSIQEQTLTFVPKVIGVALVYMFLGGWMLRLIVGYSVELFHALPQYGAL